MKYIDKKMIKNKGIKSIIAWIFLSILIVFIAEFLSRNNINEVAYFFRNRTLAAVINIMLVMFITGIAFFSKKELAWRWFISGIIILFCIINHYVILFRGMPFSFSDILLISDAISISKQFININLLFFAGVIIIFYIGIFILFWKKNTKSKRISDKSNVISLFIVSCLLLISFNNSNIKEYMSRSEWDVNKTYYSNGFIYSFIDSYFGYIRKKPEDYSKENLERIRNEVEKKALNEKENVYDKVFPNILFVQLEGFMDPSTIPNIKFNNDPTPNFKKISKENTSGYMNVSTTGGGTAKTEFEVYTGSSFKYLIPGEIPYVTILNNNQVPSIATYMNSIGYKTHAIHNYEGNFYNRNKRFENLGFNTYTSYEYMNGIEYTQIGYPKDKILTKYINEALNSTKEKDLICTISVQGHSPFDYNNIGESWPFKIMESKDLTEEEKSEIEYYAYQVSEMDKFIEELNNTLVERKKNTGEDTVVVYYGDHMPKLSYLFEGDEIMPRYKAPYTFFSTYDISKENLDNNFADYQLSTKIFEYAGIGYGPIQKFHKYMKNDDDYMKKLELVQYDILFGEKYYLKSNEEQKPNKIKMGINRIKIDNVTMKDGKTLVEGENFTTRGAIYINNKKVDTVVESSTLLYTTEKVEKGDIVTVKQIGRNNTILSSTKEYVY